MWDALIVFGQFKVRESKIGYKVHNFSDSPLVRNHQPVKHLAPTDEPVVLIVR